MSEDPSQRVKRIGSELRAYFAKKSFSQQDIADALNIHQTNVSELFLGKRPFGKNAAMKWHRAFGLSVNWLITGEGSMFDGDTTITQNNVHGDNVIANSINKSSPTESDDTIEDDLIPIIPANINPQKYGSIWDYIASNNLDTAPRVKIFPRYEHYFQCITDAMEPEYYRGDLLGIKQHDPILPIINGAEYVVYTCSGALIRMVEEVDDGYILRAYNTKYKETFFSREQISGIFNIVGLLRKKQ